MSQVKIHPEHAPREQEEKMWELRLYVAGQTTKSVTAFANLKKICEEYLAGRYRIEVIDLLENPRLAQGDQIVAIPTLVRKLPEPVRKIMGTCRTPSVRWWACNFVHCDDWGSTPAILGRENHYDNRGVREL